MTREVVTIAGVVGTVGARDGGAAQALFHKPAGVLAEHNTVWITEANNIDIRLLDGDDVSIVAGNASDDPRLFCENISPEIPPDVVRWMRRPGSTLASAFRSGSPPMVPVACSSSIRTAT